LDDACGFDQTNDRPCLVLRDRTALGDFDQIASLVLVLFVVRMVLLGQNDNLAIERMLDAALNQHGYRFVHLVADHAASQRTLQLSFAHGYSPAFSRNTVRTRAM